MLVYTVQCVWIQWSKRCLNLAALIYTSLSTASLIFWDVNVIYGMTMNKYGMWMCVFFPSILFKWYFWDEFSSHSISLYSREKYARLLSFEKRNPLCGLIFLYGIIPLFVVVVVVVVPKAGVFVWYCFAQFLVFFSR